MANQQLYPQTTYPLRGDIQSNPGSQNIIVTGLQTIPVGAGTPGDKQVLQYSSNGNFWSAATVPFNQSVLVNSVSLSDDYDFSVNHFDLSVTVNSAYAANGKPVLVNGV